MENKVKFTSQEEYEEYRQQEIARLKETARLKEEQKEASIKALIEIIEQKEKEKVKEDIYNDIKHALIFGDFDDPILQPFMLDVCGFLLDRNDCNDMFSRLSMIRSLHFTSKQVNSHCLMTLLSNKKMITQKYAQYIVTDSNVLAIGEYLESTNNEK